MLLTPPSKALENEVFTTWLHESGVVISVVKKEAVIDLEEAVANTYMVLEVSEGVKHPMLVDTRDIKSITKAARDHFSMKGRDNKVLAIALLVGSPLSRVIGNFFIGLNKSTVPVKLFNNAAPAMRWLNDFKEV